MFVPRYVVSPKLLANIKRIAMLTADLNRRSLPGLVLAEMQRRATSLSAHTSTRIEGNPLPLTEVRRLLKSLPANLRDSEREVANYNQALEKLNLMVLQGQPGLSLRLILDIQKTVMKGLLAPSLCGRLRDQPVLVKDPASGQTAYLPPDFKDVKALMTELLDFAKADGAGLDPLILAGLVHRQFVIIHPFIDGNGRTARLVTKVLLAAMGINTFPLFSFENYYSSNVTRYFAEVGVKGDYYDLRDRTDFTSWLEYFTDGIIDELLRVSGELDTFASSPGTTLQKHHLLIIEHIRTHGFITDRDYARLTDRAKATRALDFRKLIEWGRIERHDKGKNTHYKLKEDVHSLA